MMWLGEKKTISKVFSLKKLLLVLIIIAGLCLSSSPVSGQTPVIHGILFYSPTCPHCHQVINQDLPPILARYPEQIMILAIDTTTLEGQTLYLAAIDYYQVSPERRGVPMLIVGDVVLVGALEIPGLFPGIIEAGIIEGGIDWPAFPGMLTFLIDREIIPPENEEAAEITTESAENVTEPAEEDVIPDQTESLDQAAANIESMSVIDKFAQDVAGNSISVVILIGMIFVIAMVGKKRIILSRINKTWPLIAVPLLILIGFGAAIYMGYIEITQNEAICGPVGDCNAVQQSSYATLFGILPIGILGVVGYVLISFAWVMGIFGSKKRRKQGFKLFFILTLFGTLFSIYLTFLEPFVIGASCVWCQTSAVVMTLLLLYSQGYLWAEKDI